jgi:crossover junction endodeoxyribonuclease RuvC
MKILGIDPGTGIVGFGVIESDKKNHKLVEGGIIKTPANQELGLRLQTIYKEISDVINHTKPDVMVIEKLFFAKNVTTAMSVSHARGVIMLAGVQTGLEIIEYTPLQIKQSLTGYGRAEKSQVQEMVKILLGLKEKPEQDDCADALAAALTYATSSLLYSKTV